MPPNRSAALVDAGVFLQLAGDAAGAQALFRQALALDPANAKARVLASEAAVETTRGPAAPQPTVDQTVFVQGAPPDETLLGRPLFPTSAGVEQRVRIAQLLAEGAYDKALGVVFERIKRDADDVEAHELAWDILVAAGQVDFARSQLGHLVEVAVARRDVVRLKRFIAELERTSPEHPSLLAAHALLDEARVVEPDSTLIDEALRSVL
ncbi:MAG: hypothetical protein MUC96_06060 [Myxococcaceae bacterium]|jgi:Flp pilus assembly protein TadD|nr:hypothetical protein [Myxococcaceae bacterium]